MSNKVYADQNIHIKDILQKLENPQRFYRIERENKYWYYDSYTQSFLTVNKKLFDSFSKERTYSDCLTKFSIEDCLQIFSFLVAVDKMKMDLTADYQQDNKCVVMINTSNRCNLNCSYCYRDKQNTDLSSVELVKKIFKFLQSEGYKKNIEEYVISYSMTSESSLDLQILKAIAEEYINYEDYRFYPYDFSDETFDDLYAFMEKVVFPKTKERVTLPQKNKQSVCDYLNQLLGLRDLFDVLEMTESMFDGSQIDELRKRNIMANWRLYRLNRWALEIILDKYVKQRKIPNVGFWFMSNGTCASQEYMDFIKAVNISPFWISIDGPKEVHDANRKYMDNKPSYDTVMANVKKFKENGIDIRASVVLTSVYPKPLEIIRHLRKEGFTSFSITPVRPGSECSFTKDNVHELLKGYDDLYEELERTALQKDFTLFKLLKEDMTLGPFNTFISRIKRVFRCSIDNQIVINGKGEIYPCLYFTGNKDFYLGNIDDGFDNTNINHKKSVVLRGNCKECWTRYLCGGTCHYGSYKVTGDYLGIEPIECTIKKYIAEKCLNLLIVLREHNIDLGKIY